MARPPLTDEALLVYSGEHLLYEVQMFYFAATALIRNQDMDAATRNVFIESFAIHLRNLIDFLYPDRVLPDDVTAQDFIEQGDLPPISEQLQKARTRAHKEVSHLTTKRIQGGPPEKNWDVPGCVREITAVMARFAEAASPKRLSPSVAELAKGLATHIAGPRS